MSRVRGPRVWLGWGFSMMPAPALWTYSPTERLYYTFVESESYASARYVMATGTWVSYACTSADDGRVISDTTSGLLTEGAAKAEALVLRGRVLAERDRAPRTRFQIIEEM